MTVQDQKDLVEAVAAWLRFEVLCKHDDFLSEDILAYPLSLFFANRRYSLEPERPYPNLKPPEGRGRRQAVDYAFLAPRTRQLTGFMELKFAPDTKYLLGDVVRLWELAGDRYLLLATVRPLNNDYWQRVSKFLPMEVGVPRQFGEDEVPDLKKQHDEWLKLLRAPMSRRVRRKRQYKARLVALHKPPSPNDPDRATVALWQIFDWEKKRDDDEVSMQRVTEAPQATNAG